MKTIPGQRGLLSTWCHWMHLIFTTYFSREFPRDYKQLIRYDHTALPFQQWRRSDVDRELDARRTQLQERLRVLELNVPRTLMHREDLLSFELLCRSAGFLAGLRVSNAGRCIRDYNHFAELARRNWHDQGFNARIRDIVNQVKDIRTLFGQSRKFEDNHNEGLNRAVQLARREYVRKCNLGEFTYDSDQTIRLVNHVTLRYDGWFD